jgi:hypothetical protein
LGVANPPPPPNIEFSLNYNGHKTEPPFHPPANLSKAQPING